MWIKFYNFNFGETSNAYIPTYKSFKSCQFSTFLNSVWKIFTAWKLLDLGMKGFCVGMKIKGGESLAGQMESLRREPKLYQFAQTCLKLTTVQFVFTN